MTPILKTGLAALMLLLPAGLLAAPLQLKPASPQPGKLSPGLAVTYAYPNEVRTLYDAERALAKRSKKGPPLKGLSYQDTREGDKVMTSELGFKVAARITGYIKFDKPGVYELNVLSNDGVSVKIGGQEVANYDDIHACAPSGEVKVEVPSAGWYEVDTLYFQRKGTSCLMMEWQAPGGKTAMVPDAAFGH